MDRIARALQRAREEGVSDPSELEKIIDSKNPDEALQKAPVIAPVETPAIKIRSVKIEPALLRKHHIVSTYVNEPVADAYRLLRTRVLRQMSANNRRSLGITSAGPREGKSVTALNLGVAIAMEPNHAAIVIDTDFRHPCTHKYLGLTPEKGINDYLNGAASLEEILISPGVDRFAILPCTAPISGGPELLKSKEMADLLQELDEVFPQHMKIYDLPPVLIGDDAVAFSSLVDAMLLVIGEGNTRIEQLLEAKELLAESNLIGTVLNKANSSIGIGQSDYY